MDLVTLANGMKAVLAPCEAQSVAFGLFIASGSRHETGRTAGISHFIEHMLFKGTRRRSAADITREIEGRGGTFNACTGEESTVYYAHMPYEYLDEAIDVISDMYLHARIPADEFAREREVVLEEIKMYADEPDSVAAENLQRALFPKSRLGAPVAGSAKSLLPLVPEDLRDYIRTHYRPDNTVAVVVGRFDPVRAKALLERSVGRLARARGGSAARRECLAVRPIGETTVSRDVQQVQLALGYRTFGIGDRRKYAATVFDAIMGRGMSSRLFQEVREKRGLSYDIASRMQFFQDAGLWTVAAGLDAKRGPLVLGTIDRELERIRTRKVGADELRRAKEFLCGNFRLSYERIQAKLFFYGSTFLSFGRLMDPEEQVRGIREVTAEDVLAVARAILRPERRSLSWVVPKEKTKGESRT